MAITEPPNPNGNCIVRSFTDRSAPTGEATVHVTANGELWREVYNSTSETRVSTGNQLGKKSGNRIYPW